METKNQLHQLLAVEPSLKANAKNIFFDEAKTTFEKRQDHFDGIIKVYSPFDEEGDKIPDETKEIVTTVADKINYAKDAMIKAIDAEISKEETNSSGVANSEIDIGGKKYQLSATALLSLEKTLETIRSVYKSIPTLDPTKVWKLDGKAGDNIYTTDEEVRFRVIKKKTPLIAVPATDKHPAQATVVENDVQVGKYSTYYKSGRVSPLQKSNLLAKVDELILSVKTARAKANQAQVKNINIGKSIFEYINKNVL